MTKAKPASWFLRSSAAMFAVAVVLAAAIAWRVAGRPEAPALMPILLWQCVVWLPWIGFLPLAGWLGARFPLAGNRFVIHSALHLLVMMLCAAVHLAWFWQVSRLASPLLGLPGTKYGAYAFFFVFWVLIDFLLYAATAFAATIKATRTSVDNGNVKSAMVPAYRSRFTVRKGREQHVVNVDDIRWIEAQGYYAALHTDESSFLIRRSLSRLERELDPDCFVRIHRSAIVNVNDVEKLRRNDQGVMTVTLAGGSHCRVSRAGRARLKSRIDTHQGVR